MTQQTVNPSQANWRQVLGLIGARREVPAEGVRFAMDQIMTGQAADAQVAAFAFGIFAKGITAAELDAAATGMLSHAADAAVPDASGPRLLRFPHRPPFHDEFVYGLLEAR